MASGKQSQTIADHIEASGISRRRFIELCAMLVATAPSGLALTKSASALQVARKIGASRRPSVIWLHFQDCTGCTESLLHASRPDIADLIFNIISLDYHETLMAASGYQAEAALRQAVAENSGKFILVVEGSVPTKENGAYMKLAGQPALEVLRDVGSKAGLVVAIGSCASWGGISSADPNPTGALGVDSILTNKAVVNLPGCPPNPYNFLSLVLEYTAMHRLPALDEHHRPKFAYDRLIHEDCPRRGHFDAGRFANVYGDEGHRQGWCLYKLGCKGPVTHAPCSALHFNELPGVWPIGIGAPCAGCTEKATAFRIPLFQTVDIHAITPPETFPVINTPAGSVGVAAAATVGAIVGAAATAAVIASHRLPNGKGIHALQKPEDISKPKSKDIDPEGR
jgi:hydrogenase small subunit